MTVTRKERNYAVIRVVTSNMECVESRGLLVMAV